MENDIAHSPAPAEITSVDVTALLEKHTAHYQQALQQQREKNSQLEILLEESLRKIKWFEEQFKLAQSRKFGNSSEKTTAIQYELVFNAEETPTSAIETPAPDKTETITYTRQKKVGRKIDISMLPRRQERHDLSPAEKICCDCGQALHKVRDDVSLQIETIPRQLYVIEHIHPQYACRQCVTITAAEKEPSPIPKSMAGASFITDVIISKYEHHQPLYRQSTILRELGADVPDNTLGNWLMQTGEGLEPVDVALQDEIIRATYLQVDETPVKLLEPEKKAYMWVFLSPLPHHKLVRFRFDISRSGSVVDTELKTFRGLLQNDGYAGYNALRRQSTIIGLGCMAHARRKFADVVKIASKKSFGKANEALAFFAKLYFIEEQARRENLGPSSRTLLRQQRAVPVLDELHRWLLTSKNQVPPESAIGKAIDYTLKQWSYLRHYVEHGEAEIDNNGVENQIRPFALGRRNWLFVMHEKSARVAALFYSLIQSAKLNGLNPRHYIHYLLTQIHALRKKQVNPVDLLPHRISPDVLTQFAENEFKKAQLIFATKVN